MPQNQETVVAVMTEEEKVLAQWTEEQIQKLKAQGNWDKIISSKPDWSEAPEFANAVALKIIDGDDFGEWCWMSGNGEGPGFILAELRQHI